MKKVYRPFMWLGILVLVVSLACGVPSPTATTEPATEVPTVAPTATQAEVQVIEPTQTQPKPPTATSQPSNLVTSLQDVRKATIQIEAQGSFIDPEWGLLLNTAGRGSGFIIDESGIAVTNNHVVTGAALLKVWVGGDTSKTYNAKVLGVSECSDLAVIDIDGDGFSYLEWYPAAANVGLEVYTAGFPLGEQEYTLTKGIISKEKTGGETNWASIDSVLMHDATINPGNSGGPLVTTNGQVVGVNYAAYKAADQYFAIGSEVAVPLINTLKTGKDVDSVGVNGQAVVSEDGTVSGIWVSSVKSGSSADKAGIEGGDILTVMEGLVLAVDGTMEQYCDILRTHNSTDVLSIEVLRWLSGEYLEGQLNGRELEVSTSFSSGLGGEVDNPDPDDAGDGGYSGYVTIADDTGAIQVDLPVEWWDIDGSIWSENWGSFSFDAPSISAAADLDAYYSGYSESGMFFAASKDLGQIGGYIQLLDGVKGWHEDYCTYDGRYDYGEGDWYDPWYEGKFDLWTDCGTDDTLVLMLSARPKNDPTAYLLLLEVKITKDADLAALDYIIDSFQADF